MERILDQPEGRATKRFQCVLERHGTKVSVSDREREFEQVELCWVGRRLPRESVSAAAKQVLNRPTDGLYPGGKLYGDHLREQVRLRLGRCGDQARIASYLDVLGQ
jgi:hypothetical protein